MGTCLCFILSLQPVTNHFLSPLFHYLLSYFYFLFLEDAPTSQLVSQHFLSFFIWDGVLGESYNLKLLFVFQKNLFVQ